MMLPNQDLLEITGEDAEDDVQTITSSLIHNLTDKSNIASVQISHQKFTQAIEFQFCNGQVKPKSVQKVELSI